MYRTITKCDFQQVFNRNLCNCVQVKRILNIDRTLTNLPNYNQHLNGISFYFIIVTLKYINSNLMLRSLWEKNVHSCRKAPVFVYFLTLYRLPTASDTNLSKIIRQSEEHLIRLFNKHQKDKCWKTATYFLPL